MKHLSFITVVLAVSIGLGYWSFSHKNSQGVGLSQSMSLQTGTALRSPKELPKFSFLTHDGKVFTKQSLKDKWSFVFFGYSSCPELCPTTLKNIQLLSQRIGRGVPVQYLFVSIDPNRDSPERLKEYLFGESSPLKDVGFIGLTADVVEINKLATQIGIYFEQESTASEKDDPRDHIAHSGAIVLIDPEARLDAIFTDSKQPGVIAQDFKNRVSHYARA